MQIRSSRSVRRSRWRIVVYWALLPIEWVAYLAEGSIRGFRFLIIASNPLFLAIHLMNRDRRREDYDESH